MTLPFDTFFIDALIICPFAGVLLVWIFAKLKIRRLILPSLFLVWILIISIASSIYYDETSMASLPIVGHWFAQFGSGNNFMWNFEWMVLFGKKLVVDIPTYNPWWNGYNLLAWTIFIFVYPLCILFGVWFGKILFGRSDKQKGIMGLLPWFNKIANNELSR